MHRAHDLDILDGIEAKAGGNALGEKTLDHSDHVGDPIDPKRVNGLGEKEIVGQSRRNPGNHYRPQPP